MGPQESDEEQPNPYIASYARKLWKQGNSKSLLVQLFRLVGAGTKVEVVYVLQFDSGEWDRAHCLGEASRVWEFRGEQFSRVTSVGKIDYSPIASKTPIIRYCMGERDESMILNVLRGFRAGYGCLKTREGEHWRTTRLTWRS